MLGLAVDLYPFESKNLQDLESRSVGRRQGVADHHGHDRLTARVNPTRPHVQTNRRFDVLLASFLEL